MLVEAKTVKENKRYKICTLILQIQAERKLCKTVYAIVKADTFHFTETKETVDYDRISSV